jgi:L-ascorbate metabolism protein UlaG (beta-lactamase superfamily)
VAGGDIEWPSWVQIPQSRPDASAPAHAIRVTFVNHATTLVQMDGLNILTDPIWSDRVSPVSFAGPGRHKPPGVRFDDLPRIDVVLISHDHHDHCDLVTLTRLWGRDHPRIFAGLGTAALLAGAHIDAAGDLDWWERRTVGSVQIVFTPAQHWSARGATDRDRVLWGGFHLSGPSGSVYFAGDTGLGPHFRTIRERLGAPTVALLPIGAYQPEWFMSPSHMSPAQAVVAHRALAATTSVAIHWGTFDLADEGQYQPAGELTLALDARGIPHRDFRILENGESFQTGG